MPPSLARQVARTLLAGTLALSAGLVLAAPTLSVDQILARNAAARGGADAWLKVSSVSMTGKMDANRPLSARPDYHPATAPLGRTAAGPANAPATDSGADRIVQLPYRLELHRPHAMRLEIDVSGKTAVQIFDGSQGIKIRPYLGRAEAEPYTAAELAMAADEPELDGMLLDHARKGIKVALDGAEKVNGADAYRLALTLKDGSVRHVWVDATSFLEVKFDGQRHMDGRMRTIETYLKDYRPVAGLMFPMTSETVVPGVAGATRLVVDTVRVNPPLGADRFAISTPVAANAPGAR